MTVKQEEYSFYYKVKNESARKRLGFKAGFHWCTAKKQSLALSRGELAMDAAGFDEADFAKPVRVNMPIENDLPPEGVFDIKFCENREIGADGKTLVLIPGVAASASTSDEKAEEVASATETDDTAATNTETDELPTYAYNVNGELMSDVEKDMTQSVSGKSFAVRFRANWKQPQCVTDVATWRLQEINAELMDPTGYIADIELALSDKEISSRMDKLEMRDVHCYARDIEKVFPENKRPGIQYVREFTKAWLDTDYIDRGLLVKEWQKGNRVSRIDKQETSDTPEPQKTSVTKADVAVSGEPATKTTYKTIDTRIGCALTKGEITYPIVARDVERGKAIVEADGEEFKRWSATYRITENIQFYDEKTHIEMIRQAPREVVTGSPELRRAYVDNYLAAYGTLDPDQMVFMPKRAPVEHEENMERVRKAGKNLRDMAAGRFKCDEEKPQSTSEDVLADEPATAETVEPDTTERHQDMQSSDSPLPVESDKTPREQFSEQLAADRGDFVPGISDPDDPKWVRDDYSASNEVEKTEVAADDAADTADYVDHTEEFSNQPEPETNHSEPVADQNEPETPETEPEPQSHVPDDIQPGIYFGVTNEAYHAGPGVSKSQLDDIANTPAIYLWRKNAPVDTEKTKPLDIGTAFHCYTLEPDEFSNRFIIAPEFNRRTNAGKEEEKAFLESCASSGKTVITAEEGRKLDLMRQSIMALPVGEWLLESAGYCESSIYWEDPETGLLCRCRPDKIITEYNWIVDVKTTADIHKFRTAYYDYRYHVQDAFYSDGYKAEFGEIPTFVFLVASTTIECGRYPVEIFMMGDDAKLAGQREYHRNLQTLAECLNNDEWPAIKTLSLPRWAKESANV
ncbi:PD-(D/E)XK nuclease-like domain-containing protein [Salmonella enterica]|uniref:PD-(D/E)XK nuclease-like domain-containing protein n=3 Tax=Salmonella enterica TaxID=28901 RepID=UPI000A18A038|nr:PD-(D/E)XK nuclease-like domain-containing protein [Salmonella enterica]ECI5660894.1 exonuclease VIII [Salmonella enterica subsp. diarizonae]MDJ6541526.1 PD-(D/E)XK nuclease-like domain-containing protein [Salmonella enterica]MDJ7048459.1 PD-(D/E)XK nuclease-like domain-containing protein [Salmonella enterica]MDJ7337179.1 PD-(D/E)XK nuclease-like domain-containing protein [Salmonella enterica]OSJ91174.1 exonuclease VIII [Salmonella enterica subsp. enterica serovar Newport str. SHSN011]